MYCSRGRKNMRFSLHTEHYILEYTSRRVRFADKQNYNNNVMYAVYVYYYNYHGGV